jgi:hypothetical protein
MYYTETIRFLAHGLCTAPPFDIVSPTSSGYSGTGDPYLDYLPRFQAIWAAMRQDNEWRRRGSDFHASFIDTWRLKLTLLPQEVELFAGMMYAHALLAQVVHGIAGRLSYSVKKDEAKENTFPRVNGVLSTINKHVCPAIMPTMLIYEEVVSEQFSEDPNSASIIKPVLEQKVWLENHTLFDQSIESAIQNIVELLAILLDNPPTQTDSSIIKNYQYNHAKIKLAISMGVYGDREINRLEFLK